MYRKRYLKGGQVKLDANKDGKITAEDFKMLKSKKKSTKKQKPSPMMLAMRDKRNMGASKALEKDQLNQLRKREEKFSKETKKFEKRAKEAKETPGTPDDGYKRDYSNIPSKPNPKFK